MMNYVDTGVSYKSSNPGFPIHYVMNLSLFPHNYGDPSSIYLIGMLTATITITILAQWLSNSSIISVMIDC